MGGTLITSWIRLLLCVTTTTADYCIYINSTLYQDSN
jgi:hypothetical protein